jgi:hypothetical protein
VRLRRAGLALLWLAMAMIIGVLVYAGVTVPHTSWLVLLVLIHAAGVPTLLGWYFLLRSRRE